jgi:phage terminase small subunit
MPRRSAAELSVTPVVSLPSRLKPPTTLSPLALKEFTRIVTAEPAAHFKESDLSLLVQYCEAAAMAERAVIELQRDDAAMRWLTLWEKATRTMVALSMRLRLSPQSRAPNTPKRERLSYYERMAAERADDQA